MLSRSEEKLLIGLARRRRRSGESLFVAEGVRVLEELIGAGIVPRFAVVSSHLEDSERGRRLRRLLEATAPVRTVVPSELRRLAGTATPQGVLAVAEIPAPDLSALTLPARASALVLDGIQDPGNLGTLARSAAAFGCRLLACLPGTVDPWNAKAIRASAGALFRLPVVQAAESHMFAWLSRHDFEVMGADAAGEPMGRRRLSERAALVVGNEGAGLSTGVRARCNRIVAVPMQGGTESLNVAVAAGILLYEMTREHE
jgi:RNA methyltransferase, TrmH family